MPRTIYSKVGLRKKTAKPGDLVSAWKKYEKSSDDKKAHKKAEMKEGSKKDLAQDKKGMAKMYGKKKANAIITLIMKGKASKSLKK